MLDQILSFDASKGQTPWITTYLGFLVAAGRVFRGLRRVIVTLVGGKERQSFHELVTFAYRNVAVVQAFRGFAVDIEPPIAF